MRPYAVNIAMREIGEAVALALIGRCGQLAGLCLLLAMSVTARAFSDGPLGAQAANDDFGVMCGPRPSVDGGPNDYRQRVVDRELSRLAELQVQFHLNPALDALRTGYHVNVIGNLNYTLMRWPNFQPALQLLIQYDAIGGKSFGNPKAECYLAWARRFVPDDAVVWSFSGLYYFKKKNLEIATTMWERALSIDPTLAEAHYNLGLVYFETKNYEKSLEHAKLAYGGGYPLLGLRRKLDAVGRWTRPQVSKEP